MILFTSLCTRKYYSKYLKLLKKYFKKSKKLKSLKIIKKENYIMELQNGVKVNYDFRNLG